MMEITSGVLIVSTTLVGLFLFGVVYIVNLIRSSKEEDVQRIPPNQHQKKERKRQAEQQTSQKQPARKKQEKWTRDSKHTFSHPWLLTSLKGHNSEILDMDFSSNGKFIASCGDDGSVFIWSAKDWNNPSYRNARINVDFDHATHIRWSPDSKAFLIHKSFKNCIEVYKVGRKSDGWVTTPTKATTFRPKHENDIVNMDIASTGRFIMTCSEGRDLILWDLKGRIIHQLNTQFNNTYMARISPCGGFIAASGDSSNVIVWEVDFTKNGELKEVNRAFDLRVHRAGVLDFAFTADSSKMATISEDGTWAVYGIDIDYEDEEEAQLLAHEEHEIDVKANRPHIALSPDGEELAISAGNTLYLYLVVARVLHRTITNIFSGPITKTLFDATGKYVLVSGDKHIRIFHNATSYVGLAIMCEGKLRSPGLNSAMKERLTGYLREAKSFLKSIGEGEMIYEYK